MAINTNPIFTGAVKSTITRATGINAYTGGTSPAGYELSGITLNSNAWVIYTANATYGSFVQKIRWRAIGTNSSATVCRVFLNNGTTPSASTGTSTNTTLLDEISLTSTTSSTTVPLPLFELPLNVAIPAGYSLYATYGTGNTSGFDIAVFAGDYNIPA
jgi:hypothetical protein